MSNLGEDAESFFRRGDEGTYEGGPASVVPFALCETLAEDLTVVPTEEQLERRRRLKRIVATIVGALSTGLLFLFAWLLGASARGTEIEASKGYANPPPRAASMAAAPARPTEVAPASAPSTPTDIAPSSSQVVATAPIETATKNPPTERARRAPSTERNALELRASLSLEGRPRGKAVAVPKTSVARAHASFGSTSPARHSPPTANFPD